MTHPTRINDILALLTPEEIQDALWMIDVWEQWDMPAEEAAEWRRRILAHVEYVALSETKQSAQ